MNSSLLDCIEIETAANPVHAVIWLHGLGADGGDFSPLVPQLQWPGAPATRFVFPHAPVQAVTINNGYRMRAWYDILSADLIRREDDAGVRASQDSISALIRRENQRGIPSERIVVGGFSQGCAMALHTGLRFHERLGAIIGLSGYVPLADSLLEERHPANQHTPIFMAHGTYDPVVAPARAEESRKLLDELGYSVTWKTYPMPHSVCPEEILDIMQFLKEIMAPPR